MQQETTGRAARRAGRCVPTRDMRIWIIRTVLVLLWLLATHGALEAVERIAGRSMVGGAAAFVVVTAGMIWVAVHLGDVPIWRDASGREDS